MSDFAQSGLICTLQRLNDAALPRIEAELVELAQARPIALILPCHARDLERPALDGIFRELAGAKFLRDVVLSVNGLASAQFTDLLRARFFEALPGLKLRTLVTESGGKGGNVAAAISLLAQDSPCQIVATQDCDVASFRRVDLARLCYPVAHPGLGFRFAKAYYSRATVRLYGRVSRLFIAPLLHALVRIVGHQPLLDFLLSFRYPLAGETAMAFDLARSLPMAEGWGLEIGQLCEVFRRVDPRECCQVDGGSNYDHKHQPAAPALAEMAAGIARELFAHLAAEGLPDDPALRESVSAAYRREAAHALRRSAALAQINALPFDEASEAAVIDLFAEQLAIRD